MEGIRHSSALLVHVRSDVGDGLVDMLSERLQIPFERHHGFSVVPAGGFDEVPPEVPEFPLELALENVSVLFDELLQSSVV